MNIFKHIYYAVRHGEWDCGWELYKDKPMFGFYCFRYDGNWFAFHCYKFWLSVCY